MEDKMPKTTVIARAEEVYEYLVDETENKSTIHDRMKNAHLHVLLQVIEYILGNDDYNPMASIFEKEV
jgi:uncharacterized phage-like protein YoqJ